MAPESLRLNIESLPERGWAQQNDTTRARAETNHSQRIHLFCYPLWYCAHNTIFPGGVKATHTYQIPSSDYWGTGFDSRMGHPGERQQCSFISKPVVTSKLRANKLWCIRQWFSQSLSLYLLYPELSLQILSFIQHSIQICYREPGSLTIPRYAPSEFSCPPLV